MIFAIDIGNSNIVLGLVQDSSVMKSWRLSTQVQRTRDEYALIFRQVLSADGVLPDSIRGAVISSVVPSVTDPASEAIQQIFGRCPLQIAPGIYTGMTIDYHPPQDVGADRVVNAVAGRNFFGAPLIIIDMGTATTFCVIDNEGIYRGGAIYPGVTTVAESLYKSTALLPKVKFEPPDKIIGDSTRLSIQSGLFHGYIQLIAGMISAIQLEIGGAPRVICTGGLGDLMMRYIPGIDQYEPNLTLLGLELLYRINQNPKPGTACWPKRQ